MKEFNFLIILTLIALFVLVGVDVKNVEVDLSVAKNILESYPPFDGTIDTEYLSKLEDPAYVQY